jgi:succinoglycan biosynthesis protein ExoV
MKLYYCETPEGNFGDDLNPWLWPQLAPEFDFGDESDGWCFVGIGTLLNDHHAARFAGSSRTLIFGTGAGLFRDGFRPVEPDPSWHVAAVRGPLTAEVLGVSDQKAVTDAAALVARLSIEPLEVEHAVAYVPHISNAKEAWRTACRTAGLAYLDPREDVSTVLRTIAGSELVLAEAMHAAIAADALRTPWIPVRSVGIDAFKWRDWCASLEMDYRPYRLPPLWVRPQSESFVRRAYRDVKARVTALRLRWLARRGRRFLSDDRIFRSRVDELSRRLERLRDRWVRGEL